MSDEQADPERAARGAAYLAACLALALMAWLALRSHATLNALGLAFVTFAALVATPQLLHHLLRPSVRTLLLATSVGAVITGVLTLAVAVAVDARGDTARSAGRSVGLLLVIGFYAGLLGLLPRITKWTLTLADLASIADWLERDGRAWMVAGLAFVLGTGLQFAAVA